MLYTLNEHQEKKLFSKDALEESANIVGKIKPETVQILEESAKDKKSRKLIVKMEAIHVGKTRNSTFYTEEGLKGGLKSWTQPYNKPVLTHHNSHRGEPIGRILNAEYSEQTISGKSGLIFTVEITDSDAMEKVLDGRYQTVSIGASTDKVTCNICGTDRTQEWCEHYPGRKYDEQACHFIIGNTFGREISYVNTPSDENAGNISVQVVDEKDGNTNESVSMKVFQMAEGLYQDADHPEINLYENLNDDVKQMVDLLTKVKEGSDTTVLEENQTVDNKDGQTNEQAGTDNQTESEKDNKNQTQTNEELNSSELENQNEESSTNTTAETNEEVSTLKEKVSKLQGSLSDYVLENQKLSVALQTAESENKRLLKENAKLIEANHVSLVEKVVDLKIKLRKSDVIGVDREEAIKAHAKRTAESLSDSLTDLLAESKTADANIRGSVQNPGISENEIEENEKPSKMKMSEGIDLLSKMFGKK